MLRGCSPSVSAQILDSSSNVITQQTLQTYTNWTALNMYFPTGTSPYVYFKLLTNTAVASSPCFVDDLYIGDAYRMGLSNVSQITNWQSYTPTYANMTPATRISQWRRIGGSMEIFLVAQLNGPTASGAFTISLPNSNTISTGVLGNSYYTNMGSAIPNELEVNNYNSYSVIGLGGAATIGIGELSTNNGLAPLNGNNPRFYTSTLSIHAMIPITGWENSQVAMTPEMTSAYAAVAFNGGFDLVYTSTLSATINESNLGSAYNVYYGKAIAASTANDMAMQVTNLPPGSYLLELDGNFWTNPNGTTSPGACNYKLTDGTTSQIFDVRSPKSAESTANMIPHMGVVVNYSSFQSLVQFKAFVQKANGASCEIYNPGGRGASMTLIPLSQSLPMPMLMNNVATPASGGIYITSASIANPTGTNSATITRQDDSWISSVTNPLAGYVRINVASGIFPSTPNCVCTARYETNATSCDIRTQTTALIDVYTFAGTTLADDDFSVICTSAK